MISPIQLQLQRKPICFEEIKRFTPLSLSDLLQASIEQLSTQFIDSLSGNITLDLQGGQYDMPLSDGTPMRVEIPEDCTLKIILRVARPSETEGPIIQEIDGSFSKPIVFKNILTTLEEVQSLFENTPLSNRISKWLDPLKAQPKYAPFFETISSLKKQRNVLWNKTRAHQTRLENATEGIFLQKFQGLPTRRNKTWQLAFRFSGEAVVSDKLHIPFKRVRLLRSILPTISADLDDFFFKGPLATAELLFQKIPQAELSRQGAKMINTFEGVFALHGQSPKIHLEGVTLSRGQFTMEVAAPSPLQISGRFHGKRENDRIHSEIENLNLRVGDGHIRINADVFLDTESLFAVSWAKDAEHSNQFSLAFPDEEPPESAAVISATIETILPLSGVKIEMENSSTIAKGSTSASFFLQNLQTSGKLKVAFDGQTRSIIPQQIELTAATTLKAEPNATLDQGPIHWKINDFSAKINHSLSWFLHQPLKIQMLGHAAFSLLGSAEVPAITELNIVNAPLNIQTKLFSDFDIQLIGTSHKDDHFVVSIEDSKIEAKVEEIELSQDTRTIKIPKSQLAIEVVSGTLATTGLGHLNTNFSLRLSDQPILLADDKKIALLPDELLELDLNLTISPSSQLKLARRSQPVGSLKTAQFDEDNAKIRNAIFAPLDHIDLWFEILDSKNAHFHSIISLFSEEAANLADSLRKMALQIKKVLDNEEIKEPKDIIPRADMARILSLMIADDESEKTTFDAIIKQVTQAKGLDKTAVKSLLLKHFPDHKYAFELDRLLRWIDDSLRPVLDLVPPLRKTLAASCESDEYKEFVQSLPSAKEIYDLLREKAPLEKEISAKIGQLGPCFSGAQLTYFCEHAAHFAPADHARLLYASALKTRVNMIQNGFGGFGYALLPRAIALFLGGVIDNDRNVQQTPNHLLGNGLLSPSDVATFLQAGLATGAVSKIVQVNQRLLIEYMDRRTRLFVLATFAEIGSQNPRLLASALLSFLSQPQNLLTQRLDFSDWLSKAINAEIPHLADYMAGGQWAKASYYKALMRTAEWILQEAKPYFAVKNHLQTARHQTITKEANLASSLATNAQRAIAAADQLGRHCSFSPSLRGPQRQTIEAYQKAIEACRKYLKADPLGFQNDWFKKFWARNYEALVVRSIVRNVQNDVDNVRYWLQVNSGKTEYNEEQILLGDVVSAIYHSEEDQAQILADPLVRLLLDPPEGKYDFTLISAMGVVTEGAKGQELEDAFIRLHEQYGIQTIRADTGTAKTFSYNAKRIIQAIKATNTPYGLLGYSQGSANILAAESELQGGTPKQQKLLNKLVCRNFLFSALNGSAHGSGSNEKFLTAMVAGEHFLKHYQGVFSSIAIFTTQHLIAQSMESWLFAHAMGSVDSISWEGAAQFAREAQFKNAIPTSTIRGVVSEKTMPEALEFLSATLDKQTQNCPHDTQVTQKQAVGHSIWIQNAQTELLRRSDMGSLVQNCHHWSPLVVAATFVRTKRDIKLAIYDLPKDRHVFPWIEVNARFGIISLKK